MKLALFGRTRGRGSKVESWPDVQFMVKHKRRVPVAVVVVKSRLLDVTRSLETTPEETLLMAGETIDYLHDQGLEVFVDLEHAMDAICGRRENGEPCDAEFNARSLEYFHRLVAQCVEQKVSRLVVCDTTGGAGPEEVSEAIAGLAREYPAAKFGFHGHTDRGLGVANTRAAILAGAVQVQGTLLGTGERCGNVNLTTVIGGMQLRGEAEFVAPENLAGLTSAGALGVCGVRTADAAQRADCGTGCVRHMGGDAWQQRAQESRRLPVVRSGAGGGERGDWGERAVRAREYYAALADPGGGTESGAGAGVAGCKPGDGGRRRLHGQRDLVPAGMHARAGDA